MRSWDQPLLAGAGNSVEERGEDEMATEATETKSVPEKFRAHGVQNDWLNEAKGQSVEITLDSGHALNGRLVGHDNYCLALDEAGQKGETLIYKQSISFVRFSKE